MSWLDRGPPVGSIIMLMLYAVAAVMLALWTLCATGVHCVMGD